MAAEGLNESPSEKEGKLSLIHIWQLVGVGGRVLGDTVGFQDLGFSLFGDLVPQAANSFA